MVCLLLDLFELDGATITELAFLLLVGQEHQGSPTLVLFRDVDLMVRADLDTITLATGVDD